MPMSAKNALKNKEMLNVLYEQLSAFNVLLDALLQENDQQVRLACSRDDIGPEFCHNLCSRRTAIDTVQKDTAAFLLFLTEVTQRGDLNCQLSSDIVMVERKKVYAVWYDMYLAESQESTSSQSPLPAQKIFKVYHNQSKALNIANLSLALLHYPRHTIDCITDTIRDVLHYVDLLITMMSGEKQTMRDTSTPGASFFGKKHFIEPSTKIAVEEKLHEIFNHKKSSLGEVYSCPQL